MPEFEVEVTHRYSKVQRFKIEADTPEEAKSLALDHDDIDRSNPDHDESEADAWLAESPAQAPAPRKAQS